MLQLNPMPNPVTQTSQGPSLGDLARKIEELFTEQLDRIVFHQNETDNDYRVQEKRLSKLMLDESLSDEKRLEHAHGIVKLIDAYKTGFIQPLQNLGVEIERTLSRFQQALRTDCPPVINHWLSLSKELHLARNLAVKSIVSLVQCDATVPSVIIKNQGRCDIRLSEEESKQFRLCLAESAGLTKESYEANERIQQEREPITRGLLPVEVEPDTNHQPDTPVAAAKPIPPLEGKAWFRLVKVLYLAAWILGLGVSALLAFGAGEFYVFAVGATILAIVLVVLQKTFYYIILGRTTASEKPGKGFMDLEDFRNSLAGVQADNPKLYQEVVAPFIESWKAQYGRRVPLHAVDVFQKRLDQEMNAIREKKQKIINEAASKGTTIEISKLRESLERSKAEYKGADREGFIRQINLFAMSLEAKYGTAIPVDEASKILDKLDDDIRAASQKS
jgi:hypothetical protein